MKKSVLPVRIVWPKPKPFGSLALRTKLIIFFVATAVIPLGLLALLNNIATQDRLITDAKQRLLASASATAASLDAFIKTNLDAVQAEAQFPAFVEFLSTPPDQRPDNANLVAILTKLSQKAPPHVSAYALLDSQGLDVADSFSRDIGFSKADRNYFQKPLETGQPYVSPVQFSPSTARAAVYFSSPVRASTGEIIGVLRLRYNATGLRQIVTQSTGLAGEESYPVLFDEHHIYLVHATVLDVFFKAADSLDPELVVELKAAGRLLKLPFEQLSLNLPDLDRKLGNISTQPNFTAVDVAAPDKVNQVAVTTMKTQPWLVAFFQPQEVFLAPVEDQTRNTAWLAASISLVVAIIAVFISRQLARPIIDLTTSAQQVAGGDLDVRAPVRSEDETGQLAQAFNSMTDQLQDLINSLEDQVRERTQRLETVASLSGRLNAMLDFEQLLHELVTQVQEKFDYYHAHIYLFDEMGETLVLAAGAGLAGTEMKTGEHQIFLNAPTSSVARAARSAEIVIIDNVREAADWLPNPLLPDTRSEMAVPIVREGQVVGVLDVQQDEVAGLDEGDASSLRLLANQLAVALSNARLFEQTVQSKEEAEIAKEKAEQSREEAELANQAKSKFLSNMSHELRTPLNGILGYAQILRRGQGLATAQKDGLDIIQQSGEHLLTLINDILDLSKIEARKMDVYPTDINFSAFLEGITGMIRLRAEEKTVYFKFEAADQVPTGVQADEKRLRQVLLNLLGNAVKFTRQGQVTLRVTPIGRLQVEGEQQRQRLRFEVEDTGVGMTPEELQKIFLPFEQVGDKQCRAEGTGLGLTISRQLVELMGGELQARSEPGQGSLFWFEVVLPVVEAPQVGPVVDSRVTGYEGERRTILVADDKRDNRLVLKSMLEPLGFEIVLANDGQEEIDKAQEIRPDLILTDLVMPVKTGFEAVEALRQLPAFQKTPIIAVSASVFNMDQAQSKVVGCDAFVLKPVDEGQLLALLAQHLQLTWIYETDGAEPADLAEADAGELVPPPVETLEMLYELVMLSNFHELRNMALDLENRAEKYIPFAQKVQTLARSFNDEELVALFEPYLVVE